MIVIKFDPFTKLIRLYAELEFREKFIFTMAFDPGASTTVITPETATELGYEISELQLSQTSYTAGGVVSAAPIKLKSISLYGNKITDIDALCMSLPEELRVDGLLGLNFLRHFNININFENGVLNFQRISHSI